MSSKLDKVLFSADYIIVVLLFLGASFVLYANLTVDGGTRERIYDDVNEVPHVRTGLLLGTTPINWWGKPHPYFTGRLDAAAKLYKAGKLDSILASGSTRYRGYDETGEMKKGLIARGVPEDRIIEDRGGYRTEVSVVRAKQVFGLDSVMIISQSGHDARALYLADAKDLAAVAFAAPVNPEKVTPVPFQSLRSRMREWLARSKMLLELMIFPREDV